MYDYNYELALARSEELRRIAARDLLAASARAAQPADDAGRRRHRWHLRRPAAVGVRP